MIRQVAVVVKDSCAAQMGNVSLVKPATLYANALTDQV